MYAVKNVPVILRGIPGSKKSPGNSLKKMLEFAVKKAFSRKFIIIFRKEKGGTNINFL